MRFLLDGDPGHDDMLTLFLAAKHVEVVGLTTTYGNSSVEHTTLNARKCVTLGGLTHIPIAKGSVRPLVNQPRYAPQMHGDSGLDGAELPEPSVGLHPLHAVDFILEQSRKYDDLILVPTGPLTNVASALIKDPTLADRLKGISLMGGSLTFGNTTPAAELNIYLDPEAADVVFRSGVPLRMFGTQCHAHGLRHQGQNRGYQADRDLIRRRCSRSDRLLSNSGTQGIRPRGGVAP